MGKIFCVIMIAAITTGAANEGGAQASTSVSAGPTYALQAASKWSGPGYNFQVSREFGHFGPAMFRADVLYMQRSGRGTFSWLTERTYAFAGGVLLRRPVGRVAPFALVGVGLYGDNSWAVYRPGINAGIGMDVSVARVRFFAESRIHQYLRDAREAPGAGRGITQVPISFGLRF